MKSKACDGSGGDGEGMCYVCDGTGEVETCPMCRGDGWYMSQDPGDLLYREVCIACDGQGVVPANEVDEEE